jgi:hypothetical protein
MYFYIEKALVVDVNLSSFLLYLGPSFGGIFHLVRRSHVH